MIVACGQFGWVVDRFGAGLAECAILLARC